MPKLQRPTYTPSFIDRFLFAPWESPQTPMRGQTVAVGVDLCEHEAGQPPPLEMPVPPPLPLVPLLPLTIPVPLDGARRGVGAL
jgi:hypothetical protein